MTVQRNLAIFNGWSLPFLHSPHWAFQKMKPWNFDIIGYCVTGAGC